MVVVFSWEGGVSEGGFGQPTASDLQVHHHIRLDFSFWSYPTHLHYVRIKLLLYRKSQEQPWNYMYSVSKSGKKTLVCHSNGRGQPEPQSKTVSKEQQNLTSSTSWPRSIEVLFIALTAACRACHASAPAPQVKQGFLEFVKLLAVLSNK